MQTESRRFSSFPFFFLREMPKPLHQPWTIKEEVYFPGSLLFVGGFFTESEEHEGSAFARFELLPGSFFSLKP